MGNSFRGWTERDIPVALQQVNQRKAAKRNKFNAQRTREKGIWFQSKIEAAYYKELLLRVLGGEVKYFLRQVPFDLPGNVKYRVDFMEVLKDGSTHYIEIKGHETKDWKIKKKLTESLYPVTIELIKR